MALIKTVFQKALFQSLAWFENEKPGCHELTYPPLFMFGAPRSGTTLTRLLVAEAFKTSYFSKCTIESFNALGRPLPYTTAKIAKTLRGFKRRFVPDKTGQRPFLNEYGFAPGLDSPAEGERVWWYAFGDRYHQLAPESLTGTQRNMMHHMVAATEKAFGLPFADKSGVLSVRIGILAKAFPTGLFMHIERDTADVLQSIYIARTQRYPGWLGPMPNECSQISHKTIHEQVSEQVFYVKRNIARELAAIDPDRKMTLTYREVCENPRAVMERVAGFLEKNGFPAKISGHLPPHFQRAHGLKIEPSHVERMLAHYRELKRTEADHPCCNLN